MKKILMLLVMSLLLFGCSSNISDEQLTNLRVSMSTVRENNKNNFSHKLEVEDVSANYTTKIETDVKYENLDNIEEIKFNVQLAMTEYFNDQENTVTIKLYINDGYLYVDNGQEKRYTEVTDDYIVDVLNISNISNVYQLFNVVDKFDDYFSTSDFKISQNQNESIYAVKLNSNLAKSITEEKEVLLFSTMGQFSMFENIKLEKFDFTLNDDQLISIKSNLTAKEEKDDQKFDFNVNSQFVNNLDNNEINFDFPNFDDFDYIADIEL